jgi:putative membrane protein
VRRSGRHDPRLLSLAIRLGVNAVALWLASEWVSGFDIDGWPSLLATAAIFGVVNAVITPVAQLLGCPLTLVTLGLFALVVNAAMLGLTVAIAGAFDLSVHIHGSFAAFWAALIIIVASWLLNTFVGAPLRRSFAGDDRRRRYSAP